MLFMAENYIFPLLQTWVSVVIVGSEIKYLTDVQQQT